MHVKNAPNQIASLDSDSIPRHAAAIIHIFVQNFSLVVFTLHVHHFVFLAHSLHVPRGNYIQRNVCALMKYVQSVSQEGSSVMIDVPVRM